jgi:hypothetical protein
MPPRERAVCFHASGANSRDSRVIAPPEACHPALLPMSKIGQQISVLQVDSSSWSGGPTK